MKIKSVLIIIAILGLVSVCSYLAYVYGTHAQKKAVIPIPPSLAEKQIKSTQEAVAKKKAAISKSKKEKKQVTSKDSQTPNTKEVPKSDPPDSRDDTKQNPEEVKAENKNGENDQDTHKKSEIHGDKHPKKAKEDNPKKVPLTNEQLKLKLERYYKTGKLTESNPDADEKIDYRLQRYFIKGGLDSYDRAKIWHEISLHDEGRKIYKEDKYSDLAKLPKNFSVQAIRKAYGEKTPLKEKNYAVLIEKVVKRPWYSRVFY